MPLEISPTDNANVDQKIINFKDQFLKIYANAIAYPNKIINTNNKLLNELSDAEYRSTGSYYDDEALTHLSNITINIAALISAPESTSSKPAFIRIREYYINEINRTKYSDIEKNYVNQGLCMSFTYPKEYDNSELRYLLNEAAFNLTLNLNDKSDNRLAIAKKVLTKLTQPGPLSEIKTIHSQVAFSKIEDIPKMLEQMPLTNAMVKDALYDNGIENHVPNLFELCTALILLLTFVSVSN